MGKPTPWHVFHFRGTFQAAFMTEELALAWIHQQKVPSEFYRDNMEAVMNAPLANPTHRILYKNHSGTIGTWEGWTVDNVLHSQSAKKIGGAVVPHQAEIKGKNIGRSNETAPAEQAILELESKTRLKLDKGYVSDIKDADKVATNTLGLLKPMLATPMEKVKPEKIDWSSAYVQPKLDGHRALYKDGVLYSRQGKELVNMGHIKVAIETAGLQDMHLDGELYVHGRPLQEVSRLIKKLTPESTDVIYHIYDAIYPGTFLERVQAVVATVKTNYTETAALPLAFVDTFQVANMDEVMDYHTEWRDEGYEGTMLRFSDDEYCTDKRSRTLLKVKEFHDAEFIVVGHKDGKPRITEDGDIYQVPIWMCERPGDSTKHFWVTAQGTMEEKHAQWERRDMYLGEMLTVKYHYLSKDGIPQLPVAMRWREDV